MTVVKKPCSYCEDCGKERTISACGICGLRVCLDCFFTSHGGAPQVDGIPICAEGIDPV